MVYQNTLMDINIFPFLLLITLLAHSIIMRCLSSIISRALQLKELRFSRSDMQNFSMNNALTEGLMLTLLYLLYYNYL